MKNVKASGVFSKEGHHEVEVLNFLIGATRIVMEPVARKIKDTIQQIS